LKVASYNIHKCRGTDGRVRPDRIVNVLGEIGAGLVALQEVDNRFGQRAGLLDPDLLRRETGLHLLAQSNAPNGHGWHGNALLVAQEPAAYRRLRISLPGMEPRGAIIAELDLGEGRFRVVAAHLGLLRRSRMSQANALLSTLADLPPMPTLVLGDFNEWRRHRRSSLSAFEPLFGKARLLPSFPSWRPTFALDRIIGWPQDLVSELAVHDTPLARKASDHLPLKATIALTAA
jgi:endonuclease/exonuclease/phosphatase family metal-dependent hydrolase